MDIEEPLTNFVIFHWGERAVYFSEFWLMFTLALVPPTAVTWVYNIRRIGHAKRLCNEEAARLAYHGSTNPLHAAPGTHALSNKAAGYEWGFSYNTKTLEELYKKRDWLLFWSLPISMLCFFQFVLSALRAAAFGMGLPWMMYPIVELFGLLFPSMVLYGTFSVIFRSSRKD